FYDFQPIFVVGGGTAGCVLARKLSDSGEHSVLVLEAGILPDPGLDVPALASSFLSNSNYTRTYYSVPQQNADLENGGITTYRVGRTLGGSSQETLMNTILLKYFRRTETYNGVFPATDQHGYDGPINVSLPKYVPLLNEWLSAGQFLVTPFLIQMVLNKLVSFCPSEYSKRRGRRVSSYAGYLKPVLGQRKNLKVILKAEARRIIFNGNQAIGVQFRSTTDGFPTDNARNEIIVSAGAVETPALLMKSGIGPKQVLNAARHLKFLAYNFLIRPVKCHPVGQNLQKSAAFIEERDLNLQTFRYLNEVGDGKNFMQYLFSYLLTRKEFKKYIYSSNSFQGPYAAYSGFGGQAFISTTAQGNQTKVRDIQLFHFVAPCVPLVYPNRPNIQTAPWEVATSAFVLVANPLSRGNLTLNLIDVNSSPVIDFQYLTHPTDMKIMLDGNLLLFTTRNLNLYC
ncbi:Oxygen-dependent choline dehydrogenase, partial [Orchesella cincta]